MNKADSITRCRSLEAMPNIGRAMAADLRLLGIRVPGDLAGRDPYELHRQLCVATGQQHDPCVIDTFIAAVRFAEGGPPVPWWHYTAERKRTLAERARERRRAAADAPR